MKDMRSEPVQYEIDVRKMKLLGLAIGAFISLFIFVFMIFIPLRLTQTKNDYRKLETENSYLLEISSEYRCSSETLTALAQRMDRLEGEFSESRAKARRVIAGMENDLRQWLPEGAVGGGDDAEDGSSSEEGVQLTPSQLARVIELKQRMSILDNRLGVYDRIMSDLVLSWEERSEVFAAMPSLWPLVEGRITSNFGMRVHPISRALQMHDGLDISAPEGTQIHATAPGRVLFAGRKGGYGNTIILDHGFGLSSRYAHCYRLLVKPGQKIKKGQVIAEVGTTGQSTGSHLHFEVRVKGVPVNPLQYLSIFAPGPMK